MKALLCLRFMAINTISVDYLIKEFDLQPHPEGGYFREPYRAQGIIKKQVLPPTFKGDRNYSTTVYFLLPKRSKSRLHRLPSDEVWHFYLGGPLKLIIINKEGAVEEITLGHNVQAGHKLQYVVPAGLWFGSYPAKGTAYSFVGCTVAPGFDFADLEMAKTEDLLKHYPQAKKTIEFLAT